MYHGTQRRSHQAKRTAWEVMLDDVDPDDEPDSVDAICSTLDMALLAGSVPWGLRTQAGTAAVNRARRAKERRQEGPGRENKKRRKCDPNDRRSERP